MGGGERIRLRDVQSLREMEASARARVPLFPLVGHVVVDAIGQDDDGEDEDEGYDDDGDAIG
jgi:hypothetical protein